MRKPIVLTLPPIATMLMSGLTIEIENKTDRDIEIRISKEECVKDWKKRKRSKSNGS